MPRSASASLSSAKIFDFIQILLVVALLVLSFLCLNFHGLVEFLFFFFGLGGENDGSTYMIR